MKSIVISEQGVVQLSPFTTTEHPLPSSAFVHRDKPRKILSLLHSLPPMTPATSHVSHIKVKSKRQPSSSLPPLCASDGENGIDEQARPRDPKHPQPGYVLSCPRTLPPNSNKVWLVAGRKRCHGHIPAWDWPSTPYLSGADGRGARLTPAPDDRDNLLPSSIIPPDRRAHFRGEPVLSIDCQMPDGRLTGRRWDGMKFKACHCTPLLTVRDMAIPRSGQHVTGASLHISHFDWFCMAARTHCFIMFMLRLRYAVASRSVMGSGGYHSLKDQKRGGHYINSLSFMDGLLQWSRRDTPVKTDWRSASASSM
ncbi:uncharacterized protein CLUP02_05773 [Colletotrichum lupini]|uniref:Uncharacterized protein n=1 Tax=Colletotrichum lupini TaxID=145971 RepID=A0A9Q8SNS0_9PEZI|nr:uncharacterized protein CLUP02_05773 [Colletotrichum lupini]UQC80290.1 hypothetical protein CLUP02_05773 [Colletotrichum lupini]